MKIEIKNCTDCGKHRIGNSGIYCIDYPGRHIDKTIPEWCSHKKVKSSVRIKEKILFELSLRQTDEKDQ